MNYTQTINIDINDPMAKSIKLIANENDIDSRYVKVAIYADSVLQDVSGMTATAVFVVNNTLVNDSVVCTTAVDGVTVPISGLEGYSGMLKVQIKLSDNGTILQTPIAFIVKLTSDIARNAEINENTIGTIADLAQDISTLQSDVSDLWNELEDYYVRRHEWYWGSGLIANTTMYGTTISVDKETGDLNSSDQNGSSIKLVGSYQLFGNYCTMNGYISEIGYNQTCIFSLPVSCVAGDIFNTVAYSRSDFIPFRVYSTESNRSKITIAPVENSSTNGSTVLYFNIIYKYQ